MAGFSTSPLQWHANDRKKRIKRQENKKTLSINNLGRVVDFRYHEAHRTMMKLHNIVVLTTFTADMFQGY